MKRGQPLYRSDNTSTHGLPHRGGEARWARRTKATLGSESMRGSMHGKHRNGRDYTPLFKFLLARVGRPWDEVHAEAVSRLDKPDPIFWLVALREDERRPFVRIGERTYYSGLYVDTEKRLAIVDPNLRVEHMEPLCDCCTYTFNGHRFTRPYKP